MRTLLTGGAGYIGSHTAVELIAAGHEVVIIDNLANSRPGVIDRIKEVSGRPVTFHEADVANRPLIESICMEEKIDAVIHFAGLKAVGESVENPLLYYETNLMTAISLCKAMTAANVNLLVFSSSCTVYGEPEYVPLNENCRATEAANPYGRTKVFIERILRDLYASRPAFNIALLRYFNPAGAHPGARMGEDPAGIPNNLLPALTQVAIGMRDELLIHGDDYPTPDGTCIRDYIHIQDLARGHVAALNRLTDNCGLVTYNLGTGRGYSVKEVVAVFEQATGRPLKKRTGPRRPGDVPRTYCDPALARKELNWRTEFTIEDICRHAWRWQQENPAGYG